ncbi:hypothetical protein BHU72_13100 [Desulfuribacillus stibiiarsenatis]|uniref:Uncharacterized protein n=1 Tax=Desulfuribacillus stibiiarsenatis TaxID=1390249 RepID=A0A1E5L8R7_9FIRM|nr:hypothetical protein [Desulfuribacillus stibiiarsenatis]OEH86540.1 hypothetical protein BHU72_13100 [Desulfuribacillus stibiiarsenatis]
MTTRNSRSTALILGFCIALLAFLSLFIGVKVILGNQLEIINLVAFSGFALIMGIITMLLFLFAYSIALSLFIGGLIIGNYVMFQSFVDGMTGWGDLVGIISLFTWVIIGLVAGIVAQLVYSWYRKFKK